MVDIYFEVTLEYWNSKFCADSKRFRIALLFLNVLLGQRWPTHGIWAKIWPAQKPNV